jgi:hypothetical protein
VSVYARAPPENETRRRIEEYKNVLELDKQTLKDLEGLTPNEQLVSLRIMSKMGLFDKGGGTLH